MNLKGRNFLTLKDFTPEEITVGVNLNAGSCTAVSWGCDLTYDYVHINGDYRS